MRTRTFSLGTGYQFQTEPDPGDPAFAGNIGRRPVARAEGDVVIYQRIIGDVDLCRQVTIAFGIRKEVQRTRLAPLKGLEKETRRLRRAVSGLALDKLILTEEARENF